MKTKQRTNKSISKNKKKAKYKVNNWSEYNQSLKKRGSLECWIPKDINAVWYVKGKGTYTDTAIEFCLVVQILYRLPLRQTQGFIHDLFQRLNIAVTIPDYTTLSRRKKTLSIILPTQTKEKTVCILDSTGLKVYGEGEWKVRKHGWGYRRTWKKLHLGVDVDGEIRALSITGGDVHDCTQVDTILEQAKKDTVITDFYGDGAYDTTDIYHCLQENNIATIHIPPQKNAKIQQHGNTKAPPLVRDEHLRAIRKSTRKKWKQDSGYHIRSLGETAMYRFKTIFGDTLSTRTEASHDTEIRLKAKMLNIFTHNGMPDGVMVSL